MKTIERNEISRKSIVFTGGGSAGHIMINLVLIKKFREEGWNIHYIGSKHGMEKELVSAYEDVHYYGISSGKLRRYWDWNNVKDPFKVLKGIVQSYFLIRKIKANVVFAAGGFVSVPVVIGGWLNRVPVLIREPDRTFGLANRISLPFATKVCTSYEETGNELPLYKVVHIGGVVREELKEGSLLRGMHETGFTRDKPVLLMMGGSQGARILNEVLATCIDDLLTDFQVVHLCGKGKAEQFSGVERTGYKVMEYAGDELPDLLAMADVVVSRAGSTSLFELLSMRKPMLLVPLSNGSRGEQRVNSEAFQQAGYAEVLPEEDLNGQTLTEAIRALYRDRESYINQMKTVNHDHAADKLVTLIKQTAKTTIPEGL
ncbi:undecaprenyldiphospho-muramoylpentapeptide beta-N-acetylglucosaminyltransferase [Paenibacillus sp. Marseille-Q4541]|uniref:undecaprenyldiphospho-muramoylpentapeptide beta-N-acetylglucosaminyltransferase n=1 Tax=Paenibacillus sp. Marseille-Q4541 TaxID=2831522 RepID=UPI001BAA6AA7|nr:undecaprenyldiphospho-muramoylpentapeptide beta-N-acetylglucosaminyltransferase [Paenibacillus sp. Marseille-Q4541]